MVWPATKKTTCAKAALPRRVPSPVRNTLKDLSRDQTSRKKLFPFRVSTREVWNITLGVCMKTATFLVRSPQIGSSFNLNDQPAILRRRQQAEFSSPSCTNYIHRIANGQTT
jgi:hypothetical protein